MSYHTPLSEQLFVLDELYDLAGLLALPGFEDLSPDLVRAVLDENARFVQAEIAPLNVPGDTHPAQWHEGVVQTTPGFQKAFGLFAQGGWQGLQHPAALGGQGFPKLVGTAAIENLNAANLSFALCPLLTDGVIEALSAAGSAQQQACYIPPLIQGRWTGTMNLTEPQAGSDLALLKTRAVPQPDGSYRISGQKIFITFGEHDLAENIIHLVLARLPDAPPGIKGISLFIVPKFLVAEDGSLGARNDVWCASLEHKLGIHASPTAVMLYGADKGQVGEGAVGHMIGEPNRGLQYMFIMMNAARFAVGVQGIAVAERAWQKARAYAAERLQGAGLEGSQGPVSIDQHPDVQRMLATMRALTEGGRALAGLAALAHDRARHSPDAPERERQQALYEYLVPVLKGFCTENAVEVSSLGLQVHGGMGYIEETGAAQYFRDARILPIYEGTTAIQANDFLGRKTWRDKGAVAQALAGQMQDTLEALRIQAAKPGPHQEGLALLARNLESALEAYTDTLKYMLAQQSQARAALLGSVPYLMLAGLVIAGWQMARAALICHARLQRGDATDFHGAKLAGCVLYAGLIMPRARALQASIHEGVGIAAYMKKL